MTSLLGWITATGLFALTVLAGCSSDNGDHTAGTDVSAECQAAAEAAAAETDSARAEPLIAQTLQACTSGEEWLQAVRDNPGVLGLTADAEITEQDLELACHRYADAPACQELD